MGTVKTIKGYEMKYENLLLLLISCIVVYMILTPPYLQVLEKAIRASGQYGYFGVLIAGSFFAYGITSPIAAAVLIAFGSSLNPILIAAIGAAGATFSDFIIFKFAKRKLSAEIERLKRRGMLKKYSKTIQHFAPLIAGFIIGSPLPDELAAGFLGAIKFSNKKFILFIYAAEFIGILALALIGSFVF